MKMKIMKFYLPVICILFFSLSLGQVVKADIYNGTKHWGGTTVVTFDSSVDSYGYRNTYNAAMNQWKNISSKVVFSVGNHTNADRYYVGNSSDPTLWGTMFSYGTATSLTNMHNNWHHARVWIYHNNMEAEKFDPDERIGNATHEVGHSLKLAHPGELNQSIPPIPSIMNQGIQKIAPTTYDKSELRRKWGQ